MPVYNTVSHICRPRQRRLPSNDIDMGCCFSIDAASARCAATADWSLITTSRLSRRSLPSHRRIPPASSRASRRRREAGHGAAIGYFCFLGALQLERPRLSQCLLDSIDAMMPQAKSTLLVGFNAHLFKWARGTVRLSQSPALVRAGDYGINCAGILTPAAGAAEGRLRWHARIE